MLPFNITAEEVAAEIVLLRSAHNKTLLVLEGDSDDKFMTNFIDHEECETVVAWGRQNVLDCFPIVKSQSISGVLGIVDSDYQVFFGKILFDSDIVVTDERDVEVMLFKSHSFNRVIVEVGSRQKFAAFVRSGKHPRDVVLDVAYHVGLLRFISIRDRIDLTFEGLKFRYLNRANLQYDLNAMVKEICNLSQQPATNVSALVHEIKKLELQIRDKWSVCNGHDLCDIFGKSLASMFGAAQIKGHEIESRLRGSFSDSMFKSCDIYKKIRAWEAANAPYLCLRPSL